MKKIFRTLVCLLSCALIALSALASPRDVHAEDIAKFTIGNAENVSAGSEFTVALDLSGTYQIHIINLAISFDPKALELQDVENGELLSTAIPAASGFFLLEHESIAADGYIKLGVAMPIDALTSNGELFKMTFKVLDGVNVNQQIKLNIYELSYMPLGSKVSTPIKFETVNSIVTINGANDPQEGFDPGMTGTAEPHATQIPTHGNSENNSSAPVVSHGPNTMPPTQPGNTDAPDSSAPESKAPGGTEPTNTAEVTNMPNLMTRDPQSGDNSGSSSKGGVKPVVYVLIGVAAAAIAAVITLVIKKKQTDKTQR